MAVLADSPSARRIAKKDLTARIVAERLVDMCYEHGDLLSNLRLQKLLYYAQAWYLALYNQPLFSDRFEAWVHGPTQPEVYAHFRHYGPCPITRPHSGIRLSVKVEQHLQDVLEAYGGFSAFDLERLTQEEQPRREARGGLAPDEESTAVISTSTMKRYYRARLDEQAKGEGQS